MMKTGQRWEHWDDQLLSMMHQRGVPKALMAHFFERKLGSIESRLHHLDDPDHKAHKRLAQTAHMGVTGGVGRGLPGGPHVKAVSRALARGGPLADQPCTWGTAMPDNPRIGGDYCVGKPLGCGRCGDDTGQCNCYLEDL
jgi:hypothetical protein